MNDPILSAMLLASLAILLLSALVSFYRIIRGPLLTDRVVALDLIGMILVASMVVLAVYWHQTVYLDATLVFAMVGFLATVGISRYLERGSAQ